MSFDSRDGLPRLWLLHSTCINEMINGTIGTSPQLTKIWGPKSQKESDTTMKSTIVQIVGNDHRISSVKVSTTVILAWSYPEIDDANFKCTLWTAISLNVMGWQYRLKFIGKTNRLKISLQMVIFTVLANFVYFSYISDRNLIILYKFTWKLPFA